MLAGGIPAYASVSHEHFTHNRGVAQLVMHPNWCQIAGHYVREYWMPWSTKRLPPRNEADTRLWFDSGHLAALGLAPAFSSMLGSAVKMVRIRRSRIDLAYSKAVAAAGEGKNNGPCSPGCTWCHCPIDAATRCIPPGDAWVRMTPFQRYLWEVDEVECKWTAFRRQFPTIKTLEIDWEEQLRPSHIEALVRCASPFPNCYTQLATLSSSASNPETWPQTRSESLSLCLVE